MKNKIIQLYLIIFVFSFGLAQAQPLEKAQKIAIQSSVSDDQGKPVPGAKIFGDGGATVVKTEENGQFTINVVPGSDLLIESAGYESKIQSTTEAMKGIVLKPTPYLMGESDNVKIAFRTVKRADLIGAASVLETDNFADYDNTQYVPDALTGRVAGLLGGNLRGLGNTMVVLDGIPSFSSIFDVNLNLEEIDQITVLKDVAAVALYGSQARNGVIIITTKRGKAHKRELNIIAQYGIAKPKALPKFLGSADYMEMYNKARISDGLPAQYDLATIENYRTGNPYRFPSVDYYSSEHLKSFNTSSKILMEVSGGNEITTYYANMGWGRSGNLVGFGAGESSARNVFNTRANVNIKINNFIKSNLDIAGIFDFDKQPTGNYWGSASTLRPYLYAPLLPMELIQNNTATKKLIDSRKNDVDGRYMLGGTQQNQTNPFADVYVGGYNQPVRRTIQFNNGIDVDLGSLVSGLTLRTNVSMGFYNSYVQSINNSYSVYAPTWSATSDTITGLTPYGTDTRPGTQNVGTDDFLRRVAFLGQLDFIRTFSDVHNISATLLGFANTVKYRGTLQPEKNANLGLRLGYNFKHKYYFDFSSAYSSSPRLPEGNKGGLSPTLSLGWVLSEEAFMDGIEGVNFLKLKASAGIVKSDMNLGGFYFYDDIYNNQGTFSWTDGTWSNQGITSVYGPNPNLGYEKRKEINVGLEGRVLDKLIGFDVNYFNTHISDKYTQTTNLYPGYYGDFTPYANYGVDAYSGIELGLDFAKRLGDFSFDLGLTGSSWNSKVITRDEIYSEDYLYRKGKPVDAIFGLESEGFFRDQADINNHQFQTFGVVKPGDIKYKDQNNDGVIDNNDQVQIGRSQSPLSYGLTLKLTYKNLTLFAIGEGRSGADSYLSGDYYWVDGDDKYSTQVLNSWTVETAATATYPRLSSLTNSNNYRVSDFWMYKNNYFDIRRLQLTYDMPANLSRKLSMNNMSIYISASNLATFSKRKDIRELNVGTEPQYRYYSVGLRSKF